jgi:hypothetical protein
LIAELLTPRAKKPIFFLQVSVLTEGNRGSQGEESQDSQEKFFRLFSSGIKRLWHKMMLLGKTVS